MAETILKQYKFVDLAFGTSNLYKLPELLLRKLNMHTHLDGYRQLCLAIPMFAENPGTRLSKELYPAIADKMALADPRAVEHSIRMAITDAWARRDPAVWDKYFPGSHKPPNNKAFLCRLAELLEL